MPSFSPAQIRALGLVVMLDCQSWLAPQWMLQLSYDYIAQLSGLFPQP